MLNINSTQLFRDTVSTYLPEYLDASEEDVRKDIFLYLEIPLNNDGIESSVAPGQSIKDQLELLNISIDELLEDYLSSLALLYIENPKTKDELVLRIIDGNQKNFNTYIEEAILFTAAFQRIERKEKKEFLKNLEEQIEEEELEVAFARLDRKEKKEELSQSDARNKSQENTKESSSQKFTLKSIMRIAALFIILLNVFLNGNSIVDPGTSFAKHESKSQDYFASNTLEMTLPETSSSQASKELITTSESFGFANDQDEIIIEIQSFVAQLTYLKVKRDSIELEIGRLESKKFKHKKSTLDSLQKGVLKIDNLKKSILLKGNTYDFNGEKVILNLNNNEDLQKMKVFNYNDQGKDQFFLKIASDYYLLTQPKGKLKSLADQDIIEALNLKDSE